MTEQPWSTDDEAGEQIAKRAAARGDWTKTSWIEREGAGPLVELAWARYAWGPTGLYFRFEMVCTGRRAHSSTLLGEFQYDKDGYCRLSDSRKHGYAIPWPHTFPHKSWTFTCTRCRGNRLPPPSPWRADRLAKLAERLRLADEHVFDVSL